MNETMHDCRFPGESGEYRETRDELLRAEVELVEQIERIAAMRRDLPPEGRGSDWYPDYSYDDSRH